MATSIITDFKVQDAIFQAARAEGITENVNGFNAASRNGIRLIAERQMGLYQRNAFFKNIAALISRRNDASVSAATAKKIEQEELVAVKCKRKIGPAESTLDAIRQVGSQDEFSLKLGRMVGEHTTKDMLNTAILAVTAALLGQAASYKNYTSESSKLLTTDRLAETLSLMGDAAANVVCWAMHSKPYFDLLRGQISGNIVGVSDAIMYGAVPATLNRPVVVTDLLYTVVDSSTTNYAVLGLAADGVVVYESEASEIVGEVVTGYENLIYRLQGEYAETIGVKGFKWDITNGGANPTDAAIATTTNWDAAMASVKDRAGVVAMVR